MIRLMTSSMTDCKKSLLQPRKPLHTNPGGKHFVVSVGRKDLAFNIDIGLAIDQQHADVHMATLSSICQRG